MGQSVRDARAGWMNKYALMNNSRAKKRKKSRRGGIDLLPVVWKTTI